MPLSMIPYLFLLTSVVLLIAPFYHAAPVVDTNAKDLSPTSTTTPEPTLTETSNLNSLFTATRLPESSPSPSTSSAARPVNPQPIQFPVIVGNETIPFEKASLSPSQAPERRRIPHQYENAFSNRHPQLVKGMTAGGASMTAIAALSLSSGTFSSIGYGITGATVALGGIGAAKVVKNIVQKERSEKSMLEDQALAAGAGQLEPFRDTMMGK